MLVVREVARGCYIVGVAIDFRIRDVLWNRLRYWVAKGHFFRVLYTQVFEVIKLTVSRLGLRIRRSAVRILLGAPAKTYTIQRTLSTFCDLA